MKRIILLCIFLSTLLFVFYIVLNRYFQRSVSSNSKKSENTVVPSETGKNEILRGLIWTSGLSDSERSALNIQTDYQLVKGVSQNNWQNKIDGMFLESEIPDLGKYLGKCVEVEGSIPENWKNLKDENYEINGKWTYNRSLLKIQKITALDFNDCVADFNLSKSDYSFLNDSGYKKVSGKLKFSKRPAPDIAYDMEIFLDTPIKENLSSLGNIELKNISISASSKDLYKILIENIGKKSELGGFMVWGYAETRYLLVDSVNLLQ